MFITPVHKRKIAPLAREAGLEFLRVFGSALNKKNPRDVDLVYATQKEPSLRKIDILTTKLEKIFGRPVDLIRLRSGMTPEFVIEVGKHSTPIWEKPKTGRLTYAILLDRLLALAWDEKLSIPEDVRRENPGRVQRNLNVA